MNNFFYSKSPHCVKAKLLGYVSLLSFLICVQTQHIAAAEGKEGLADKFYQKHQEYNMTRVNRLTTGHLEHSPAMAVNLISDEREILGFFSSLNPSASNKYLLLDCLKYDSGYNLRLFVGSPGEMKLFNLSYGNITHSYCAHLGCNRYAKVTRIEGEGGSFGYSAAPNDFQYAYWQDDQKEKYYLQPVNSSSFDLSILGIPGYRVKKAVF